MGSVLAYVLVLAVIIFTVIDKTVGLRETEEEMNLDYCRENFVGQVPYALSNSLGFGGHNASILIGRWKED